MNIARSSVKLVIATSGSAIITFLGIAYFARLLTPNQLGIYFLFEALLAILVIPADFGIRGAVEKRISEEIQPARTLTTGAVLKFVPLCVVITGLFVFRNTINRYVEHDIAFLLAVAVVASELYQFSIRILGGELRVGETAVLRLTERAVWAGGGIALVHVGMGVRGVIYAAISGYLIAFVWGMARKSVSFGRPSVDMVKSLFSYSKYNFASALSGYAYSWVDILIIGFFLTNAHVGAYETAWRVTAVVILGSRAIAASIFPQVSQWDATDAIDRIESLIPHAVTASLLIVIPGFFGTTFLSAEIMQFVFGPEYIIASAALTLLMGEKIFQAIHSVTGRSLKAIDKPALAARAAVASTLLNLGLNILLVLEFGLIGAAVATVTASLLNTAMCIRYLSRFLKIRFEWWNLGWIVVSSIAMTLVLLQLTIIWPVNSPIVLISTIAVSAGIYGVLLLLFAPLRRQVLQSVSRVIGWQKPASNIEGGD